MLFTIPLSSSLDYCLEVFKYLESVAISSRAVIIGDFNFPDICWATLSGQSPSSAALRDLVFHYNLTQIIDFPTHSMGNTLDLALQNSYNLMHNINTLNIKLYILTTRFSPLKYRSPSHISKNSIIYIHPSLDFKRTDLDVNFCLCFCLILTMVHYICLLMLSLSGHTWRK